MKNYNDEGMRMTDCCQSASTYFDATLVCKGCYEDVELGEGDGNEYKTSNGNEYIMYIER